MRSVVTSRYVPDDRSISIANIVEFAECHFRLSALVKYVVSAKLVEFGACHGREGRIDWNR
jgi:hypothetical protein